jgi:hypothetical protein
MTKLSISGLLFVVVAGVIFLFRHISGLMGNGNSKEPFAIVDMVAPESLNWIDGLTFLRLNDLLDTIVLAPLYILLFIVGAVLLIISGFKK